MRALAEASSSTAAVQPYMTSSSCTATFGSKRFDGGGWMDHINELVDDRLPAHAAFVPNWVPLLDYLREQQPDLKGHFIEDTAFRQAWGFAARDEGEWVAGKSHGHGKKTYADGNSYEGEWAEGKKHGKGTYTFASGAVAVFRFEADAPVGQGVKWSADRTEAWELQAGEEVRGIPLDEAAKIAERIGLPPP